MRRRLRTRHGGRVWRWLGLDWVWEPQWVIFVALCTVALVLATSDLALTIAMGINTAAAWVTGWRPLHLADLD